MNDQRAAFEAWVKRDPFVLVERKESGEYLTISNQIMWQAWQAAIEHAKKC